MQIALVLYPGFTVLDIIGPFQTLAEVPGHDVVWVAETPGPVMDHTGKTPLTATHSFADVPSPDVVVVPGGTASDVNIPLTAWLRAVHPTTKFTTSVCTGSILLAAAGLLDGLDAATHWGAIKRLEAQGARYSEQRVIRHDRVITAAGVSSGIDMGLTLLDALHGPMVAQAVQLFIEYDPQPPFDSGSVRKAPPEVVALVRSMREQRTA
jgi:putative intracellular protease/amidase